MMVRIRMMIIITTVTILILTAKRKQIMKVRRVVRKGVHNNSLVISMFITVTQMIMAIV